MTTDDDRAIDRFVAGVPVDAEELATAITAKAIDRALVVQAMLENLSDSEPVIRRRAAERAVRLPDLAPELAARLRVLVVHDEHAPTRAAALAALRAHGEEAPGDAPQHEPPPERWAFKLLTKALVARSGTDPYYAEITPRYRPDAPNLKGYLYDESGAGRVEFRGLPGHLTGTRPALRARPARGEPMRVIAIATDPVTAQGTVTMRVELGDASIDDVATWLREGDLVVPQA